MIFHACVRQQEYDSLLLSDGVKHGVTKLLGDSMNVLVMLVAVVAATFALYGVSVAAITDQTGNFLHYYKKIRQTLKWDIDNRLGRHLTGNIALLAIICSACIISNTAAFGFNKDECISRLSKETDPPFLLSPDQAAARCNDIELRIAKLSKQILGKWHRKGPKGTVETMNITADGVAKIRRFNYADNKLEDVVRKWAIENPYGTPGKESLQFDDSWLSSLKLSANTMIITSQPASATIVERWKRSK